jgi:enoyl-CoA hydratase
MADVALDFTVAAGLGTVVINRPEKLNALDLVTFRELEGIAQAVRHDRGIRGLLVMARGERAFSAGADINDLTGVDSEEARSRATYRRFVLQDLAELPVPSVAVVEGLAMGGGVELALACTFRVASPSARFSFPEIKLGLMPGAGATQRLPRVIGTARALDMMLTARVIDAAEALRIGLVDRVADDAPAEGRGLAAQWMQFGRDAIAGVLAAVACAEQPIREGLASEGRFLAGLSTSADAHEGISAFLEKRAARFNRA